MSQFVTCCKPFLCRYNIKLNPGFTTDPATGHLKSLDAATVRRYMKSVMNRDEWDKYSHVLEEGDKIRHAAR